MSEIEAFENEGGVVITICSRCNKARPIWEETYCLSCWLELHPLRPED